MPFSLTAFLYLARAALHLLLNHSARCLAHLLGIFDSRFVVTFSTPAAVASTSRNASILAEHMSLSVPFVAAMVVNANSNSFVDVCSFHLAALALYYAKHSPSIHLYVLFLFLFFFCRLVIVCFVPSHLIRLSFGVASPLFCQWPGGCRRRTQRVIDGLVLR